MNIIQTHVEQLCKLDRSYYRPEQLMKAAEYIQRELTGIDYIVQQYKEKEDNFRNIIVRINNGKGSKRTVIGAHYDSCGGVGADDNASSVAVLIELAKEFHNKPINLDIVFFTLEEPPCFGKGIMGSKKYFESTEGKNIDLMINLDMIGFYTPEGQDLFVGSYHNSNEEIEKISKAINGYGVDFKVEDIFGKHMIYDMADHMWFYPKGIKTLIVCDGGPLRNDNYHRKTDTPDTLDYTRMQSVYEGFKNFLTGEK